MTMHIMGDAELEHHLCSTHVRIFSSVVAEYCIYICTKKPRIRMC